MSLREIPALEHTLFSFATFSSSSLVREAVTSRNSRLRLGEFFHELSRGLLSSGDLLRQAVATVAPHSLLWVTACTVEFRTGVPNDLLHLVKMKFKSSHRFGKLRLPRAALAPSRSKTYRALFAMS
jgi:hypothetical protein